MSKPQRVPVTLGASLLTILGGSLGLFAAVAALTGDALGRVNLLFSLVLFALLPALLLLLTLALLLLGRRRGILHGLLQLQLLPRQLTEALIAQPNSSARRAILFFLSQVFAFAFAAGSLAGFGILLLATDVSFVWRSTLLQAGDLYPLLSLIGSPWGFWPEAQASLAMLDITQDFRLAPLPSEADYVGQWWRYLLAAQLCYSLAPRLVLLSAGALWLKRSQRVSAQELSPSPKALSSAPEESSMLAPITTAAPKFASLIDAAHTPAALLSNLEAQLATTGTHRFVPASAPPSSLESSPVILLVRSWEPPLGEIADFIAEIPEGCDVYLAPLAWQGERAMGVGAVHRDEWRRFCAAAQCHYLQLAGSAQEDAEDA